MPRKRSKPSLKSNGDSDNNDPTADADASSQPTSFKTDESPPTSSKVDESLLPSLQEPLPEQSSALSQTPSQTLLAPRAGWFSWNSTERPAAAPVVVVENVTSSAASAPNTLKKKPSSISSFSGASPSRMRFLSGAGSQLDRGTPLEATITAVNASTYIRNGSINTSSPSRSRSVSSLRSISNAKPVIQTDTEVDRLKITDAQSKAEDAQSAATGARSKAADAQPKTTDAQPNAEDAQPSTTDAQDNPSTESHPTLPPDTKSVPAASSSYLSRPFSLPSTWIGGWWSRPDGYQEQDTTKIDAAAELDMAAKTPLPESDLIAPDLKLIAPVKELPAKELIDTKPAVEGTEAPLNPNLPTIHTAPPKSWFFGWSRSQSAPPVEGSTSTTDSPNTIRNSPQATPQQVPALPVETQMSHNLPGAITGNVSQIKIDSSSAERKPSAWAFWSNANGNKDGKEVGELAVFDTPSQSRPEAAQYNQIQAPVPLKPPIITQLRNTWIRRSVEIKPNDLPSVANPTGSPNPATIPKQATPPVQAASAPNTPVNANPDLVLPLFEKKKTHTLSQKSPKWGTWSYASKSEAKPSPTKPARLSKALAIGVHGYFPPEIYQRFFGAASGTSLKFASNAAQAIKSWTEAQGYECEVNKLALEGQGLIGDRVSKLWELMGNGMDEIKSADLILLACHSQGVPVTVMLVERLIKFRCVSSHTKIGICAMAGVNLGPSQDYKPQAQLLGVALELFKFSEPGSHVSRAYAGALDTVLQHGVKVLFAGSMDDKLVSLESSTFVTVSHPSIYRAVFIDGRHHSSDFLTELIGFTLKLRNLGISDHGLIRELSPAIANAPGWGGNGHSRLYEGSALYDLAMQHTMESCSPSESTRLVTKSYQGPPTASNNPYLLPFAVRGVLEEDKVRGELNDECREILQRFDKWQPISKALKDVRFRLEGIRQKLEQ